MPIPSTCWPAALVTPLTLKAAAVGLVSLWLAVGSLCVLLMSFFVGNIWVQFAVFLAVSFLCLVIIHPLARKYANPHRESINADRVVGIKGVVTQTIDNLKAQDQITVNGTPQTARIEEGCPAIPADSRVRVLRIEGAKVTVSPLPVPTPKQ